MLYWWWSISHWYVCILLYVKLLGFISVAWIYGQFGGSICHGSICAVGYICILLGVTVLHGSMLN